MGPWRLELLRLWRTRRMIMLAATFLILGLGEPVVTYFLPDLLKGAPTNGVQVILPKPTAARGFASFASNVAQLGTVVVVVAAAASLTIDARPSLAAFYRSRLRRRPARLVLPRYLTITAAAVFSLALGTLGAWYETTVLLGTVPLGGLVAGLALEALWICFVTSVVAVLVSVTRSVLGAVGSAIALLLGLGLLGGLPWWSSWLPTGLATSIGALVQRTPPHDTWHAAVVTCVVTVGLVGLATDRLGRREL
jgi:ABC-2 type transport system permease protein